MTIDELLAEVNGLHVEADSASEAAAQHALQVGKRLLALKKEVKKVHRGWVRWAERNLTFDIRTAQRYMRLAQPKKTTRVSHPPVRTLRLGRLSGAEYAEFRESAQRMLARLHNYNLRDEDPIGPALVTIVRNYVEHQRGEEQEQGQQVEQAAA